MAAVFRGFCSFGEGPRKVLLVGEGSIYVRELFPFRFICIFVGYALQS